MGGWSLDGRRCQRGLWLGGIGDRHYTPTPAVKTCRRVKVVCGGWWVVGIVDEGGGL